MLNEIREKIDEIDNRMKPLFLERLACSRMVAEEKAKTKGEVYIPKREREIIEKRSKDIGGEQGKAYCVFLKDLMQISRTYQYGILEERQEEVLGNCLKHAGLTGEEPHSKVAVRFCCGKEEFGVYIHMVYLNHVVISAATATEEGECLHCRLVLEGTVRDEPIKRLVCQLGKETEGFEIKELLDSV